MEINTTHIDKNGQSVKVFFRDVSSEAELEGRKINGARAFCMYRGKLVIVYEKEKGAWSLPGGGTELGETVEQTIIREVKEETNMNVLKHQILGFLDVYFSDGVHSYTFSYCDVEPFGDFVSDVGGEVTEVKLIPPEDFEKYRSIENEIDAHLRKRALDMAKNR